MQNQHLTNGLKPAATGDYLHLHFLVFLWGFTSILGMLMQDLDALQVVIWRGTLTVSGLVVVISLQRNWQRIPFNVLLQLLGIGAILAAHWLLFFAAARLSNVSTCLAGLATCAFWTSLLEPLLTGRRFRPIELGLGLVVFLGLNLIVYSDFSRFAGLMVGVLSAICSALFSVLNVRYVQLYKPITITFYELLGCTLSSIVAIPFLRIFWPDDVAYFTLPEGATWLYLIILAWLCTVYAYTASVSLMTRFTVFAMNLTINLEPVYGIVLAWLFFGQSEAMTPGFYAGTLIILGAVLSYPALSRRWTEL